MGMSTKLSSIKDSKAFSKTIEWLNEREYPSYNYRDKINNNLLNIFITIISLVAINIIFVNLVKLNSIKLLFIQIGGLIFLISTYFFIKYSWKIIKESRNWYLRQKFWLRYLILIVILALLLLANHNRETLFDSFINFYNSLDFYQFSPMKLGVN